MSAAGYAWRLTVTFVFVLLNGFFVAAEFALVKLQPAAIQARIEAGASGAKTVGHILTHLDRYLSACQLGITVASLILGWLAEPAVAQLLLAGVARLDLGIAPDDPILHGVALAIALTIVTTLHMTVGEQAPKIWAITRSESTALLVAYPLRLFAQIFMPFIHVINGLSNLMLRGVGLSSEELHQAESHTAEDLKNILSASAQGGHINNRQLEIARNVLDMIGLEVRHIMVPRVDIDFLGLEKGFEANLETVRQTGHSRFPLCAVGLDTVTGIVHAKDILLASRSGAEPDLSKLARRAQFVSDTQAVSRLIVQLQRTRNHCCVVVDEHGTTVGMAYLEDAVEEIVGPILDEFDDAATPALEKLANGVVDVPGSLALPEAADALDLGPLTEEADTIGGYVVALLGRLPRRGDQVDIGAYRVTLTSVVRRRVERLRFEPLVLDVEE